MTFQRHEHDPDDVIIDGIINDDELTFMERYMWANLGWFFIEAPTRLPDWTWWFVGAWMYPLGNRLYELAYDRWWELNKMPTPWKDGMDGEAVN